MYILSNKLILNVSIKIILEFNYPKLGLYGLRDYRSFHGWEVSCLSLEGLR